jgi:hypothetical protein
MPDVGIMRTTVVYAALNSLMAAQHQKFKQIIPTDT